MSESKKLLTRCVFWIILISGLIWYLSGELFMLFVALGVTIGSVFFGYLGHLAAKEDSPY